ncbi:unnamed protein product [Absidia cylindrospora]
MGQRLTFFVMYNPMPLEQDTSHFLDMEKQAMRQMTKATELTEGLWIGNTADAPTDDLDDDDDDDDDANYTVCIECHDLADMPTPSILTLARETLNDNKNGMIHLTWYRHVRISTHQNKASVISLDCLPSWTTFYRTKNAFLSIVQTAIPKQVCWRWRGSCTNTISRYRTPI